MPNGASTLDLLSRARRPARLAAAAGLALLLVAGLSAGTPIRLAANAPHSAPRLLENSQPFSFADLVERVSPAVVSITSDSVTTAGDQDDQDDDNGPDNVPEPFRQFFNQFYHNRQQGPQRVISAGSGFIIDKSGLVVTNNHVIDKAKKITVKLADGRNFQARLIGTDPATDIALLKIKSDKPFPTVEFADDRKLRVGDWVVAVGNPFGLSNTVTAGIVSSIGRDIGQGEYDDFIQIDASINRGNSGGPAFNLRGQVIGMNSDFFSPSGGSVGIGFAIPASTIHNVVAALQAHGHVSRGWLGVSIQSVTPEIAASLGLKNAKGALIAEVEAKGPADKAGFKQGDIITDLNGRSIRDNRDLTRKVALLPAGKTASFSVLRNGKPMTLTAMIALRPDEKVAARAFDNPAAPGATAKTMGLGLAALTPNARKAYNLGDDAHGTVITSVDPDSDAAENGLQPGDVVVRIGGQEVTGPADVENGVAAAKKSGRKSVLLLIAGADGGSRFVALKFAASKGG